MIKEIFLVISVLVITDCKEQQTLVNGPVVYYAENPLGNFLNVYNHRIRQTAYESYDVTKSKIECRWIQMAVSATVASVSPKKDSGEEYDCWTHAKNFGHTSLMQSPGWISFVKIPSNAYFSPKDALYYTTKPGPSNPNQAKDICCYNNGVERQPIVRTENQKERLKSYMEKKDIKAAYIGTYMQSRQMYWDDDKSQLDYSKLKDQSCGYWVLYFKESDEKMYFSCSSDQAVCVCTVNLFDLPWEE